MPAAAPVPPDDTKTRTRTGELEFISPIAAAMANRAEAPEEGAEYAETFDPDKPLGYYAKSIRDAEETVSLRGFAEALFTGHETAAPRRGAITLGAPEDQFAEDFEDEPVEEPEINPFAAQVAAASRGRYQLPATPAPGYDPYNYPPPEGRSKAGLFALVVIIALLLAGVSAHLSGHAFWLKPDGSIEFPWDKGGSGSTVPPDIGANPPGSGPGTGAGSDPSIPDLPTGGGPDPSNPLLPPIDPPPLPGGDGSATSGLDLAPPGEIMIPDAPGSAVIDPPSSVPDPAPTPPSPTPPASPDDPAMADNDPDPAPPTPSPNPDPVPPSDDIPTPPAVPAMAADEILQEGAELESARDYAGAVKLYAQALSKDPVEGAVLERADALATNLIDLPSAVNPTMLGDLKASAKAGSAPSAFLVGRLLESANAYAAAGYYEQGARAGHVPSMKAVGQLFAEGGKNLDANPANAAKWMAEAARRGDSEAQYTVGDWLYHGKGIEKDLARAVGYLRQAADGGEHRAMDLLGVCYVRGEGVTQDFAEAAKLFERARTAGNSSASGNLGVLYINGQGVPKDQRRAADLFRQGAEAGSSIAMLYYAQCLESGIGLGGDKLGAEAWYRRAAAAGNDKAKAWVAENGN
ncbi:MAG: tetratricopeptide repeat protein [Verrucomicrobiales bacterium]